jgi:preprotein translocase subunit SecE
VKDYAFLFWLVALGVIFGILWRRGQLVRLSNYVGETREELKKCTWPTVEELKGSTVVVMLSIALLGGFTIIVDLILVMLVKLMYG